MAVQVSSFISNASIPLSHQRWNHTWIRPQNGTIVIGPSGPLVGISFPSVNREFARTLKDRKPLPPLSLERYKNVHLLNYLGDRISDGFVLPQPLGNMQPVNGSVTTEARLSVLCRRSASPHVIAKLPEFGTEVWWGRSEYDVKPRSMSALDERIRICNSPSDNLQTQEFKTKFSLRRIDRQKLTYIWTTQASRVFSALEIPPDHWEDYGFLTQIELILVPVKSAVPASTSPSELSTAPKQDCDGDSGPGKNPQHYLFIRTLLRRRFPDGFPDICNWLSGSDGEPYYWSRDVMGRSVITEAERVALGLPRYIAKVKAHMDTWTPSHYDFMRELQRVKGFDPDSMEFANAMGVGVIEVVKEKRFEVVDNDNDFQFSSPQNTVGEPMDVDSAFPSNVNYAERGSSSIESVSSTGRAIDIVMDDCCPRVESDAGDFGMEVDG